MVSKDGPEAAAGTWLLGLGTFWGTGTLVLSGIGDLLAVLGHRSSCSFCFRPEDSPPLVIMPLQKASLAGRKSCALVKILCLLVKSQPNLAELTKHSTHSRGCMGAPLLRVPCCSSWSGTNPEI